MQDKRQLSRHPLPPNKCIKMPIPIQKSQLLHPSDFPNPPRRHHTSPTLTLDLTPPIALIRTDQYHILALLHRRLALGVRLICIKRFHVADFLRTAAPGCHSGTLLAAYGGCGGVDTTC
jgi:hypothetical protein